MIRTVYYPPDLAARGGGEPANGVAPMPEVNVDWVAESYAIALAGRPDGSWMIVHVHSGEIYAEADDPTQLIDWLEEYADAVVDEARENA